MHSAVTGRSRRGIKMVRQSLCLWPEDERGTRTLAPMWSTVLLLLGAIITLGCAADTKPVVVSASLPPELERHCTPPSRLPPAAMGPDNAVRDGLATQAANRESRSPPSTTLTPQAQRLVEVLGLQTLLSKIERLQEEAVQHVAGADLRLLDAMQDLSDRFLKVMIDVSEIVAELDCERVRSEELAVRLEELENDRRNKRTVTAVMAEPIFHILAASSLVFGLPVVAGGLEVVGNGLRLGFGLAADRVAQKGPLSHSHNFMLEVWEGAEQAQYFPPAVWGFLNQSPKEGSGPTRREIIVTIWRDHLGTPGSSTEQRRTELFFGSGGVYGVRDLRHRADMLGVLSTFVTLIIHDISALFQETLVQPSGPLSGRT